jgi:NADPH:quinone reductase-like Zn-dependent oxidoreductase
MKALVFERNGEPTQVLHPSDLPDPLPGPGEALVRILLAPVHPSDLHIMRGRYGRQPSLPASPGIECVAVVEKLGANAAGPSPGTRVVLLNALGTWRQRVVYPAEQLVAVPDDVTDDDAAQAIINPVTAWALTMVEHRLTAADQLTQTAAGSTVARLVLQLAKSEGFRTVNLVRRRAQVEEITRLGGDAVLCTEDEDWPQQLVEATEGGPMTAIDSVAGRVGATLARTLAPGGRLLVFGAMSSHRQTDPAAFEMPIFAPGLVYRSARVEGWFLFRWFDTTPIAQSADAARSILARLANGTLRLPPAVRFKPAEVADALAAADGGVQAGKPLLDFS